MNPLPQSLAVQPPLPHNHARYDSNGNMTNDGSNTLVYDAENRVLSASNGGASGAYVFDGNNLRVKRCLPNCTSPTTTVVYIFSGSRVLAEYDNGAAVGSPSREYIYGNNGLLAKIDSSGTNYYHQDHLSNRVVTSSSGTVTAQLGHYPYGETWYNSTGNKLLFTTYERDAESGNDYAMARSYVSRLARFSSVDRHAGQLANPQSLNRYTYVLNNPINFTDPSGKECVWDDGSFDSADDPDTGSVGLCMEQGGTWFDPDSFDGGGLDWSDKPNDDLASLTNPNYDPNSPALTSLVIDDKSLQGSVLGQMLEDCQSCIYTLNNTADIMNDPRSYALWYGASLAGGAALDYLGVAGLGDADVTTLSRVYRVFGNVSKMYGNPAGASFTPFNPAEIDAFELEAGLPPTNSAEFVMQGELPLSYPVEVMPAEPMNGLGGGLTEFRIANPKNVLYWTKVSPF